MENVGSFERIQLKFKTDCYRLACLLYSWEIISVLSWFDEQRVTVYGKLHEYTFLDKRRERVSVTYYEVILKYLIQCYYLVTIKLYYIEYYFDGNTLYLSTICVCMFIFYL